MSTGFSSAHRARRSAGPIPIPLLLALCLCFPVEARAQDAPAATPVEAAPPAAPPARAAAPEADASPPPVEARRRTQEQQPRRAGALDSATEPARRATKPGRRKGKPQVVGVLNVNRASEAELRLLPGIGKGRAAQIVQRRSQREFRSLDDLARMRGLKKLVQRLRGHLAVSGDTTLRPVVP